MKNSIDADTSVENAAGDMGWGARENFLTMADGENTGKNYDDGVRNGIDNNTGPIFASVSSLGHRMLGMLASIFDSHSPSKETEKLASYFDQGLVVGIDRNKKDVLSSVSNLGKSMVSTFSNSFNTPTMEFATTGDGGVLSDQSILASGIENNISPRSLVINFYPQTMTDFEIDRAAKKIREEWGAELG